MDGSKLDEFSITKTGGGGGGHTTMLQALLLRVQVSLTWQVLLHSSYHSLVLPHGLRHQQTLVLMLSIVNKGGFGSETAGQNMNWGIWMNSAQQVKGGFETVLVLTFSLPLLLPITITNGTMQW